VNLLETKTGRATLATGLYFTEGAPIGFIWWAMPTLLRSEGIQIESITSLTAILIFPWIFKFLWAPLIDSLRSGKEGFKFWILISQIFMGVFLLPLLFIQPANNFFLWGIFLFLHSIFAATQDVSIDALVINIVANNERGKINGFMNAGMLIGRSIFGGGSIIIAGSFGLNYVIIFLILTILSTMFLLIIVQEPKLIIASQNSFQIFKENFLQSFSKINTWVAIIFALTSASAFESTGALAGPFLNDLNINIDSIGVFFAIPVVLAMLFGGIVGGYLSDRVERKKSVALFLIGFVLSIIIISIYNLNGGSGSLIYFSLFTIMYFFVGLFTTSSYALFMDLTNPRIGGTQFSTYMAATNGCEAWAVWLAGITTASFSYSYAFILMSIISLLSLGLLKHIKWE
jgi:PAT family beta-lactamase induction signal transducer AmpG